MVGFELDHPALLCLFVFCIFVLKGVWSLSWLYKTFDLLLISLPFNWSPLHFLLFFLPAGDFAGFFSWSWHECHRRTPAWQFMHMKPHICRWACPTFQVNYHDFQHVHQCFTKELLTLACKICRLLLCPAEPLESWISRYNIPLCPTGFLNELLAEYWLRTVLGQDNYCFKISFERMNCWPHYSTHKLESQTIFYRKVLYTCNYEAASWAYC